jgi:hypothetical protein
VVARVTSGAPGVDPGDVTRELGVASHLAAKGAAVVPPSDLLPPGPHERDGHVLAFWRYVEPGGEHDPAAAGEALRTIHDGLADYTGELPRGGRIDDVRAILTTPSADAELLCDLATRPLPRGQAIHGDAHLGNCLPGPLWHDFETACTGPREYDLAAIVLRDRWDSTDPSRRTALAAYGEHDEDVLEAALPVYGAWICASYISAAARRPELVESTERLLAFLRRYA